MWPDLATRATQKQVIPSIFGRLMWPTLFIICDLFWCCWIRFVKIFFVVSMVLTSEFLSSESIFSYFFFSSTSSQITRREKKQIKKKKPKTPKLRWWHHRYHKKNLNNTISMTSNEIPNNENSEPHESSKDVGVNLFLGHSYGLLWSPLLIFFSVVRFVSLRSFQ